MNFDLRNLDVAQRLHTDRQIISSWYESAKTSVFKLFQKIFLLKACNSKLRL